MTVELDRVSSFKQRLRDGDLLVGTLISEIRNPNVMYMLAQSGFDFVIIDCEHGAYSPETVSDLIAAARGAGVPAIVRICEIRRETILKPLDSGAAGLLVPQVNTVEQAREVVFHAKYPAEGNRGVAGFELLDHFQGLFSRICFHDPVFALIMLAQIAFHRVEHLGFVIHCNNDRLSHIDLLNSSDRIYASGLSWVLWRLGVPITTPTTPL